MHTNKSHMRQYVCVHLRISLALLFIFLFIGSPLSSQEHRKQEIREQIMSERIAFFTKSLDLTKKEAREFWPVYNQFEKQKQETRTSQRAILNEYTEGKNRSAGEYIKLADRYVSLKKIEYNLYQELNHNLKGVLPPAKIIQLYLTEEQFKRHLIQQLRSY